MVGDQPPHYVDKEDELVKILHQAYIHYTENDETPLLTIRRRNLMPGRSRKSRFRSPIPEPRGSRHQVDEYIEIEDIVLATAIIAKAVLDLTNMRPRNIKNARESLRSSGNLCLGNQSGYKGRGGSFSGIPTPSTWKSGRVKGSSSSKAPGNIRDQLHRTRTFHKHHPQSGAQDRTGPPAKSLPGQSRRSESWRSFRERGTCEDLPQFQRSLAEEKA